MAVIVPFEGHSPTTIDRLIDLVTADMGRVNTTILSRTGSQVTMIPEVANHLISSGGKRLRPILTLAMARRRCDRTGLGWSRGRCRQCHSS